MSLLLAVLAVILVNLAVNACRIYRIILLSFDSMSGKAIAIGNYATIPEMHMCVVGTLNAGMIYASGFEQTADNDSVAAVVLRLAVLDHELYCVYRCVLPAGTQQYSHELISCTSEHMLSMFMDSVLAEGVSRSSIPVIGRVMDVRVCYVTGAVVGR